MNEEFLSYLWKNRLYRIADCRIENEDLKVLNPGKENPDSGPDFFNAKIQIGTTVWAGNIEIHNRSSDWFRHNHHNDERYDNIILHVVYENDQDIFRRSGEIIPVLSLKDMIDITLYNRYQDFIKSKNWIPCINLIHSVKKKLKRTLLNRMLFNRINSKANEIERQLVLCNHSWNQVFYNRLFISFGFRLNNHAFELLFKSMNFDCINEARRDILRLESLLFGQSGLLQDDYKGEYPALLHMEYEMLRQEFSLSPIDHTLWKFLRLRPNNFPTIRISQLAHLLNKQELKFQEIVKINKLKDLYDILEVSCSDYWCDHYLFDVESNSNSKKLGRQAAQLIIINTIIPMMFAWGKVMNKEESTQKAVNFLREIPAEKNSIVKRFSRIGFETRSAFDSQALLQMKSILCDQKKCIRCQIGNFLIKRQ